MNVRLMLLRRLHREIPEPPVDEPRLLHEVSATGDSPAYTTLTNALLQRLSAARGVDFATALLYDRVRRSAEHGRFIHDVESLDLDLARLPRLRGTVLLVPAPFYRELPEFGGDGRLMRQVAGAFGLRVELVPVPSVGSVRAGAEAVRRAVTDCVKAGATPVVLVSLSKGSADVRVALESGLPTAAVRAWVQVCGLVRGSPWVNRILSAWPDRLLLAAFLGLAGGRPAAVRELAYGPGTLLGGPFVPPPGLLVISVVGFPLRAHLAGTPRRRHAELARLGGPNDGATLLRDAMLEPGLVYPVWGADHYFRVPFASEVMYRIFTYLARVEKLTVDDAQVACGGVARGV